jgi:hypothetical protein
VLLLDVSASLDARVLLREDAAECWVEFELKWFPSYYLLWRNEVAWRGKLGNVTDYQTGYLKVDESRNKLGLMRWTRVVCQQNREVS